MRGIVVGIVIAAVLAPAAAADRAQPSGKGAPTPAAICKQLRSDAAARASAQAGLPGAQGTSFTRFFGTGKEQRNALGRCVAWRSKMLAEARKAAEGHQVAAELAAVPLEDAERCKAILAGKQPAPHGKVYRNVGDCLKDRADD